MLSLSFFSLFIVVEMRHLSHKRRKRVEDESNRVVTHDGGRSGGSSATGLCLWTYITPTDRTAKDFICAMCEPACASARGAEGATTGTDR